MINVNIFDRAKLDTNIDYIVTSVEDLVDKYRNRKDIAFISSANSLLFMDGGSDLGYMNAIDGIEGKVKGALKNLELISGCGRNYLPIGCAQLIIPEETYKFVSCPTMFLPQNVGETRNPYYAMRAALNVVHEYNKICPESDRVKEVFTPFMCAGWGGIDREKGYQMMMEACNTEDAGSAVKDFDFKIVGNACFSMSKRYDEITQEQPKNYMNTEFGISISQVIANLQK